MLFLFSCCRLNLPQTVHNVFIERLADYILVKSTFGFSLAWDGSSGVYLKMTEEHKGQPCGLCGNYNDDGSDDLSTSLGETNRPRHTYRIYQRPVQVNYISSACSWGRLRVYSCCDRNNADENSNVSETYFFVVKYIVQVVMECIFQCPFNWTGIDIELCNTVYFLSPTP